MQIVESSDRATIPDFTATEAVHLARDLYGLEARATSLPSSIDQNFRLEDPRGQRWVLKISNGCEEAAVLDFQHRVLELLQPELGDAVPRLAPCCTGEEMGRVESVDGQVHLVRLMSYLPGRPLAQVPHAPSLLSSLGCFLGRLDRALHGFSHPAMNRPLRWDPDRARATLGEYARHIPSPEAQDRVAQTLASFETHVLPLAPALRRSVIHNDANDANVLIGVDAAGRPAVTGLIDFGDLLSTYTVNELAVAVTYVLFGKKEPLEVAARVATSYHAIHPLSDPELAALFDLIGLRLAQSVSISAYERLRSPGNAHATASEADAWALLNRLLEIDRHQAVEALQRACHNGTAPRGLARQEILARRQRHLGPSLSLSYRSPLHIVRGFQQYLYDAEGRAYLDGVNNVCHVGHCHPRVVKAAQDQMALLNTNTRYLHEQLAVFAERLAATFPPPLEICYFVCSGSEANELALRLARAHTGRREMIVVDGAYHGNTAACVKLSPYKFNGPGGSGKPGWVHVTPMPDVYRGPHKASDPEAGRRYGEEVARLAARLPDRLAGFICESMLGCGGQIELPPAYLETAFRAVHEAGGVSIVDEVQVGFGRVGTHFWAFETQGVVPDIVTLGKPIGNGHPLGAVVTTAEIAASFANGMEYFNTFGGNPVSCAVGLAVLDAIAEGQLQDHARRVGDHLKTALQLLGERHPLIGDVRGRGLFLGVELVRDPATLEPADEESTRIVEQMKDEGILLSIDGPRHNVIKIKPPLPFSMADAARVVETLDRVLAREPSLSRSADG